ncbi:MAG: hypothetical protein M3T49_02190 [Candidatus Eremiobacteraeota bacterium]|nr:hypothetical protein [Candidatus Eremiobacteraeota bacterium]
MTQPCGGLAIGVDAGGSKTVGVLVDRHCTVLARATSGGANIRSVGLAAAQSAIGSVFDALGSEPDVRAVCVGAAGIDRVADRLEFSRLVAPHVPRSAVCELRNDAQIALRTATEQRPAIIVVAGTGSIVWGEGEGGRTVRAGGYGAVIGDGGSAYAFGLAAIRHAARALDLVDECGVLARSVMRSLGVWTIAELIERVHRWPPDVAEIAALAPLVAEAMAQGDAQARAIFDRQSALLGDYVRTVMRALDGGTRLPIVLAGGAFEALPQLAESVRLAAQSQGPCDVELLTQEPVLGAARCALDLLR